MKPLRLIAALALLILAAGSALADPLAPSRGQSSAEDILAARLAAAQSPLVNADPATWEDVEGMAEQAALGDALGGRANDDNDTAHYGRGSTLMIHVFISHDGGTWTTDAMNTANAKTEVAKDYYLDNAPSEANLSFDSSGGFYWFYHADLPYTIGYSGTNDTVVNDALAALGFSDGDGDGSRVDDMTMYLQNWNGGYDNVIAAFEVHVNGRAWASYGTAQIRLYLDSDGNVWAHEMGHSFGACDEYVESGMCNGGINCGLCQSWYLSYNVDNGNCQLASCPVDVSCLMINNTFSNICDYTRKHWAWWDTAGGINYLDDVKRRTTGSNFVMIYQLYHNGWFSWNNVDNGMAIHQMWNNWSVIGLRSPASADYDPYLYLDNNHNNYVANSYTGYPVDFIVGDYNHNRIGNEHIEVRRYSGDTANYNLTFESGTGMLYPDGISRAVSWSDYNVVRVWDVPLFAGEELTFYAWNLSAGMDVGLALFKSSGTTYFAGRTSAVASADLYGVGSGESFTYTVPEDDVYGLVAWSNSTVNGSFEIQIGPTPYTLAEETPFLSGLDLRLFNYDPNAIYWSVVGTRPYDGNDVECGLYADENYLSLLEDSDNYIPGSPEFVAVDYYYAPFSRDHWRVNRTSGAGWHTSEWEHDPELLTGYTGTLTWAYDHVAKVWDFYANAGQNYFFREYQSDADLNTAIYAYSSGDGDVYKGRGDFIGLSNYHLPADGGEWFNVTPAYSGWLGFVQTTEDEFDGDYSVMAGPDVALAEDAVHSGYDEVVFGSNTIPSMWWTAFGVRPASGDEASIWLYGDDAYTISTLAVNDQSGGGVEFVVGDYNHIGSGMTTYPRVYRRAGFGELDIEWEGGGESLTFPSGSAAFYDYSWPAGDVVEVWDLWLYAGDQLHLKVQDLSRGVLDLGVALFASNGAAYYASEEGAAVSADYAGIGGEETIDFTADHNDWYGLVVFNQNDNGGDYRITVQDGTTVAAGDLPLPQAFALRAASANPFAEAVTLRYSLPRDSDTAIEIFDVSGRRVRSLLASRTPAGEHLLTWDGKSDAGERLPGGVYLARMKAGGESHSAKLVRVR